MPSTIVLDLKKVSDVNRNTWPDNRGVIAHSSFKSQAQGLFTEIHENTPKEHTQLEMDVKRSGIIIDNNGTLVTCYSTQDFLDKASSLTDDQKQYIQNVAQQGLFGGGSAHIALGNYYKDQNITLADSRNGYEGKTDDAQLYIQIKDKEVKFINTINFSLRDIQNPYEGVDIVELSMVADISSLTKGTEKDTPIHMIVTQEEKRTDVVNELRKIEGQAVVHSPTKVNELHDLVQKVRHNKREMLQPEVTEHNLEAIKLIAKESLNEELSLEDRQIALNKQLHSTSLQISNSGACEQQMEAKIYTFLTSNTKLKEEKRQQFGAQKVIEYISTFEGGNASKGQKPSKKVVSNILCSLTSEGKQQKAIQKNAGLIMRQAMDSKNLGFSDRVKKLFDNITLMVIKDRKEVKEVVNNIKNESFAEKLKSQRILNTSLDRSP